MQINSIQNSEAADMLKAEIKAEVEDLREIWIPKLKEIIGLYEKGEITYDEARNQIETLREEYIKQ